ncbi:helix-turn-helix domain-containing protein [Streptomyces sp. NPDC001339]|uniref:helix-turn-helix domain-containing protein n=1 Tax=Streptomyces sp. NPDC001339 TaxID=3364563 RepID=UPI00368F5353
MAQQEAAVEKRHTIGTSGPRTLDDHVRVTKADIAARLRYIRRHHPEGPFSLAELADLAGVSKRNLASAESAEGANLTIKTLVKVVHSLGIMRSAYFLDEQVFQQVNNELDVIQELRRGKAHALALRTSHAVPVPRAAEQISQLLTGIIDAAATARVSLHGAPEAGDEEQHISGPEPPTSSR